MLCSLLCKTSFKHVFQIYSCCCVILAFSVQYKIYILTCLVWSTLLLYYLPKTCHKKKMYSSPLSTLLTPTLISYNALWWTISSLRWLINYSNHGLWEEPRCQLLLHQPVQHAPGGMGTECDKRWWRESSSPGRVGYNIFREAETWSEVACHAGETDSYEVKKNELQT